jgi:putative ABC transport system permease protein
MWSLAYKTLSADRGKLLTAVVGVAFSVLLVNVQGGLFLGLIRKASLLVDHAGADIWVGHHRMHNVDFPLDIPRRWANRIRAVDGVAGAEPYLVGHSTMTLPDGGFEYVLLMGCDPAALAGGPWSSLVSGTAESVRQTDGIIVDVCDSDKLQQPCLGEVREINGRRARVVGFTYGIQGFLVTPYIVTTFDRATDYLDKAGDVCSYFLVKTSPGADVQRVIEEIRNRVPDAEVFTKDQYASVSIDYWTKRTGIGISFGAATLLGLLVGLLIVGETLYASVLDRIHEFGALKAIGASSWHLYSILFAQAVTLALVGSLIGICIAWGVRETFSTPIAPILMPWWLSIGSCLAVSAICLGSAALPYLRIRAVDPALVLQS